MPEKTLAVATYAAGASLAAITLIYVFAPTYFLDGDQSASGVFTSGRRKGVVGLANPANDCFINSVLQALAGLGDLRLYLIRELHRRNLDDAWIYAQPVPPEALAAAAVGDASPRLQPGMPEWKVEGLQSGIVTRSLKEILDSLNERPLYRKTITAAPFVRSLEVAFRQRISRQQQDAQELLQVVAERLCDEYHAGRMARIYARQSGAVPPSTEPPPETILNGEEVEVEVEVQKAEEEQAVSAPEDEKPVEQAQVPTLDVPKLPELPDGDDEDGFPLEGAFESQIECLTCGFKPRPTKSTFCTLTLNVPQTTSTTLNACFDGMFKTEYIDDFKCANCRLLHAISILKAELAKTTSEEYRSRAGAALQKLQEAVDSDPEKPPADVVLPDSRHAPKRRIARHIRMVDFPKILAIHLSRSIYDSSHTSLKNSAKVAFPERLPLGGLLQQRRYKLLGLVTHKGSHQSGHYESFRRQNVYPPFANANTFQASGVYSTSASPISTPQLGATAVQQQPSGTSTPLTSSPDLLSPAAVNSSTQSLESTIAARSIRSPPTSSPKPPAPTSAPREKDSDADAGSLRSLAASTKSTLSKLAVGMRPGSRNGNGNGSPVTPASASARALPATATLAVDGDTTSAAQSQESLQAATMSSPSPSRPSSAAPAVRASSSHSRPPSQQPQPPPPPRPKLKKQNDRWWRISDEKIKEANTREVLGMQREVYLLFYELERENPFST